MRALLTSRPFDAATGAPTFPAALVEANPANPVSDGSPGCRWQTASHTPKSGKCLVYVETNSDAIADALLADDVSAVEITDPAALATWVNGLPTVYYVDSVTGDNSNTGFSPDTAFLTLAAAYAVLTGRTGTIRVMAPEASPLREQLTHNTATTITIEGVDGAAWYMFGTNILTGWTSVGGGIYSKALTGYPGTLSTVLVSTLTDDYGYWLRLTPNTSTPTMPAAGEFGWSSNTLYIHLPEDANPASHTVQAARRNYCVWAHSNSNLLTLRDGHFYGGNISCTRAGTTGSGGTIAAYDCVARYAGSAGGFAMGGGLSSLTLTRCTAEGCLNDGVNLHSDAVESIATLVDCVGRHNGDEGMSPHDNCIVYDNGGHYHHNGGPGVTAVESAQMFLNGTLIEHNQLTATEAQLNDTAAALHFRDADTSGTLTNVTCRNNEGRGVRIAAPENVIISGLLSGISQGNALEDVGI